MVARVVTVSALALHDSDDRCPGAVHAVAAADGALVRVRVPGGYLGVAALRALAAMAERYGDGAMDITARANVQLRGLRESDLARVATALAVAGLLPSVTHERVRNIVASPFAGIDPDERCDVRPLVAALDRSLIADRELSALPPKFLFAIDGGGRGIDTHAADLVARVCGAEGALRYAVLIAGEARSLDIEAGDVVAVVLALARHALALARKAGAPRTWRLATLPGDLERIPARLTAYARPAQNDPRTGPSREPVAPLGVSDARDDDRINLVPSIPLGRVSAVQANALARLADEHGADVRLGPWRGVALGDFPRAALEFARETLRAVGLPLDGRDGFAGVVTCAGRGGCDAALADVRADAATYAAVARRSVNVNFAGCEKRCGMRRGADADVVATARGYDVWLHGVRVAAALDANAAIALVSGTRR